MKINNLLQEAFDSTYQVYRIDSETGEFFTTDGVRYLIKTVRIPDDYNIRGMVVQYFLDVGLTEIPEGHEGVDVAFLESEGSWLDGKSKYRTGFEPKSKDSPLKIFSTVFSVLREYVQSNRPSYIIFRGERQLGNVYDRMIKKFLPPDYTTYVNPAEGITYYLVIKRGIVSS
jgi:hypothetical protein